MHLFSGCRKVTIMNIHAIQTGSVAIKARQRAGKGEGFGRLLNTLFDTEWTPMLPIYAWVIEHPEGIIVVDTGETARTAEPGYFPRWHPYPRFGVRMNVKPEDEIGSQMLRIGLSPDDVRWVVLTHLHTDHAGGLYHFPKAEIWVSRTEYAAAQGFKGKVNGYLPHRWPTWFAPRLIDFPDQPFGAFPHSLPLTTSGDVQLVATPGHTVGHLSVILQEPDHHVFFAGDTSYTQALMLSQTVDGVSPNAAVAAQTLGRILRQVQNVPTVYLPSHDPESAQRLTVRQIAQTRSVAKMNILTP
jgi:glyoxylase-like metal-dependent hydrolase (beta-lactamase superfamily II)